MVGPARGGRASTSRRPVRGRGVVSGGVIKTISPCHGSARVATSLSDTSQAVQTRSTSSGSRRKARYSSRAPSFSTAAWSFSAAYSRSVPPPKRAGSARPSAATSGSIPFCSAGPREEETEVAHAATLSREASSSVSSSSPSYPPAPPSASSGRTAAPSARTARSVHVVSPLTVKATRQPCCIGAQVAEGRWRTTSPPPCSFAPAASAGSTRPSPSRPAPTWTCTAGACAVASTAESRALASVSRASCLRCAACLATGSIRTAAIDRPAPTSPREPFAAPARWAW
mmetsp:Transcript_26408/g.86645  ORF Transcript_26408/g.86645 Transcript_26408/m.86645 type:complete len:285 (-) Transcript_26408:441-1295(-)